MAGLIPLTLFLAATVVGFGLTWLLVQQRLAQPRLDDDETRFARETLARLQELTSKVAADVDQHSTCVEEINAQLVSREGDNDEASVLAAVAQLIEANQRMHQQLATAEERLEAQARQIESHAVEARTDALTQVANRRALDDEVRRGLAEFQRSGTPLAVLLLDVDHFKKFNDTHGHQAGDEVLRGVARVLRASIGASGLVARYGGEEFAVVFPGQNLQAVRGLAEQARQAIAQSSIRFGGRQLGVTCSGGLAELAVGDGEKDALRRADEALYEAKKAGRNCAFWNDGRTSHRIRPERDDAAMAGAGDRYGDEWLFEADAAANSVRETLPQVATRSAFFDELIHRLAQWRRDGAPLALMLVQVDGYARILGDHGPAAADVVLRVTAQLVSAVMRDMDHCARLGDDTFILALPGAHLIDAVQIGERLRHAVERCRLPRKAGANWYTISVGAVEVSHGDDLRRVLERGRAALLAAIGTGRNRVVGHECHADASELAHTVP